MISAPRRFSILRWATLASMVRISLSAACGLLVACFPACAELRRIEVRSQHEFGSYERIIGKAFFTADPALAANRVVADIALAPKNAEGLVEYSGDLVVYRPKQSRGTAF